MPAFEEARTLILRHVASLGTPGVRKVIDLITVAY